MLPSLSSEGGNTLVTQLQILWAKLFPIITLNQVDLPILYWAELDNQRPPLRVGIHFVDDAYISQKDMAHMFLSNAWK